MITIRNSVKKSILPLIQLSLTKAVQWMVVRYPEVDFNGLDFIFSGNYNRSRYFRNNPAPNAKYTVPCVCIATRSELYLYNKPSLGMKRAYLWVGEDIQMECAIVHELTHHVQYERNERKGNELDTTANELTYLKDNYLEVYKEFTE